MCGAEKLYCHLPNERREGRSSGLSCLPRGMGTRKFSRLRNNYVLYTARKDLVFRSFSCFRGLWFIKPAIWIDSPVQFDNVDWFLLCPSAERLNYLRNSTPRLNHVRLWESVYIPLSTLQHYWKLVSQASGLIALKILSSCVSLNPSIYSFWIHV